MSENRIFNFYKGSQHVDHIESQIINFNMGSMDQDEPMMDAAETAMVEALAPSFFGNRDKVREFITKIRGAKPMQVVSVVNQYLEARELSELSCQGSMWKILHNGGFYSPNVSNWNRNIKIPKCRSTSKNS